jgi:hypothetical protein
METEIASRTPEASVPAAAASSPSDGHDLAAGTPMLHLWDPYSPHPPLKPSSLPSPDRSQLPDVPPTPTGSPPKPNKSD